MRLFLLECKKILFSKVNIILLLVFTFLCINMFENMASESQYYSYLQFSYLNSDGNVMSDQEVLDEVSKAKEEWTGVMDDAWWTKLKNEFKPAMRQMEEKYIDTEKMEEVYGVDWYEDFFENPSNYVSMQARSKNENQKITYERAVPIPRIKEDIRTDLLLSLYMNYGRNMMEKKGWNNEDGTSGIMYDSYNNEQIASPVYSNTLITKEEILFLKDYMNQIETFHYGDSKQNMDYIRSFSRIGMFLLIWTILIASNAMNKERKNSMMELLTSCTKGRSSLWISKLAATIGCSIVGLCIMLSSLTIYAGMRGFLGDMGVNITEGLFLVSIFTYQQGILISIGILLLGCIVTATISCFLSTFLKSSYISLTVSLLLLLMTGTFLTNNISDLLPVNFITVQEVAISNFTINIFGNVFMLWKLLPIVWLPICFILVYVSWKKYCSKTYKII